MARTRTTLANTVLRPSVWTSTHTQNKTREKCLFCGWFGVLCACISVNALVGTITFGGLAVFFSLVQVAGEFCPFPSIRKQKKLTKSHNRVWKCSVFLLNSVRVCVAPCTTRCVARLLNFLNVCYELRCLRLSVMTLSWCIFNNKAHKHWKIHAYRHTHSSATYSGSSSRCVRVCVRLYQSERTHTRSASKQRIKPSCFYIAPVQSKDTEHRLHVYINVYTDTVHHTNTTASITDVIFSICLCVGLSHARAAAAVVVIAVVFASLADTQFYFRSRAIHLSHSMLPMSASTSTTHMQARKRFDIVFHSCCDVCEYGSRMNRKMCVAPIVREQRLWYHGTPSACPFDLFSLKLNSIIFGVDFVTRIVYECWGGKATAERVFQSQLQPICQVSDEITMLPSRSYVCYPAIIFCVCMLLLCMSVWQYNSTSFILLSADSLCMYGGNTIDGPRVYWKWTWKCGQWSSSSSNWLEENECFRASSVLPVKRALNLSEYKFAGIIIAPGTMQRTTVQCTCYQCISNCRSRCRCIRLKLPAFIVECYHPYLNNKENVYIKIRSIAICRAMGLQQTFGQAFGTDNLWVFALHPIWANIRASRRRMHRVTPLKMHAHIHSELAQSKLCVSWGNISLVPYALAADDDLFLFMNLLTAKKPVNE